MEEPNANPEVTHQPRRRLLRWLVGGFVLGLMALIVGGIAYLQSDSFRNSLREKIVTELRQRLGTEAELQAFDFSWWGLTAHLEGLVIRGAPPATPAGLDAPPPPVLLRAPRVDASWRLLSLWPLRADFESMQLVQPQVHVVFYEDGSSNVPRARTAQASRWAEQLIKFRIGRLEIVDGEINWDERRVPLNLSANRVQLGMRYAPGTAALANVPPQEDGYEGAFSFEDAEFQMAGQRDWQLSSSIRFKLFPQRAELQEVKLHTPKSSAQGRVMINDLRRLDLSLNYAIHLDWEEAAAWMRTNGWQGQIDWQGQGNITSANTTLAGDLTVNTLRTGIADWEHVPWKLRSNLTLTRSRSAGEEKKASVPLVAKLDRLRIDALEGVMTGRALVHIEGGTTRGNSDLQLERATFSGVTGVLRGRLADLQRLPWAADISGPIHVSFEGTKAGSGAARGGSSTAGANLALTAKLDLALQPPAQVPPELTPVSGKLATTFISQHRRLEDLNVALDLPGSELRAQGWMQENDSAVQLSLRTTNIETIRPVAELISSRAKEAPVQLNGELKADAQWTGGWRNAIIKGPVSITQFAYDQSRFDQFSGNLTIRPRDVSVVSAPSAAADASQASSQANRTEVEIASGRLQQGTARAEFDGAVSLHDGRFVPESAFRAKGNFHRLDMRTIQSVAGANLPVEGEMEGTFDVSGTRQRPRGESTVSMAEGTIQGEPFSKLTAEMQFEPGPVIRVNPVRLVKGGVISGRATVRPSEKTFEADLSVEAIPLNEFRALSSQQLNVSGVLDGRVRGSGRYDKPVLDGEFTLKDAGLGPVRGGQLRGELHSDGNQLQWTANGPIFGGTVSGSGQVALASPYPLTATVSLQEAELRTAYSFSKAIPQGIGGTLDARVQVRGNAADPKSIAAEGMLSRLNIIRSGISMSNVEPVRLRYDNQQLQLDALRLVGDQIDFTTSGTIRTAAEPTMNLSTKGTMNLAVLSNVYPQLRTEGRVDLDAQISGTFRRPQWRGRLTLENASAQFGRLPNSLSGMKGTVVFDGTRGELEGFRAESGGGEILLGGALRYGEGFGLQFSLNGTVHNVRVRYPENLSTWIDAQLNWNGSMNASVLDGRVTINRHFIAPPNDLAQLLVGGRNVRTAITTADSPFLRNLRLNLAVNSVPEVRLDTRTARNLQTAVEIRIQGTAQQPAVLGRIGVLAGEIEFAGKRYTINRGEITFLNPFRFEPVLNLNVQARVQQYDISMDFSGPPERLNVTYRSDPPLPTRDILALLVAGGARQTSLQPSSQPLPQVTADALLSQALSSQIGTRLDRIFGNGRVRIDPQLNTLRGTASATIALEQQIKNDVTLLYVTDVAAAEQQYVQAEWTISPKLSVVGIRDQNGLVGVNFQITLRFQ